MIDKLSDIVAKVAAVLFYPLSLGLINGAKWIAKALEAGDIPTWMISAMIATLWALVAWRLISDSRKNRAKRRYYEYKGNKWNQGER